MAIVGSLSVAGCVGDWESDSESMPTSVSTASETTVTETDAPAERTMTGSTPSDTEPLRSVSVERRDSLASRLQTQLNVELPKSNITPEHTAVIEVELVNASESKQTYEFGPVPVFSATASTDSQWLLVKPGQLDRPSDGCWSHPKSKKEPGALATRRELAPDESATRKFELWSNSRSAGDGCMPSGKYRFEDEYRVRRADGADSEFTWGFTLEIRE